MKLYKYRSFASFEYTLDILVNERLHCAPFHTLNDPLEGAFWSMIQIDGMSGGIADLAQRLFPEGYIKTGSQLQAGGAGGNEECFNICSLSASLKDIRMWSHYADGHKGIAIEVDVQDEAEIELYAVEYNDDLPQVFTGLLGNDTTEILKIKTTQWEFENEYRIITTKEYWHPTITGVYLGIKVSELMRSVIQHMTPSHIPIYSTEVDMSTFSVKSSGEIHR